MMTSYTILTAIPFALALSAVTALAFMISARQTALGIDDVALSTLRLVQAHWSEADSAIFQVISSQPVRGDVAVGIRAERPADAQRPSKAAREGHAPPFDDRPPSDRPVADKTSFGRDPQFIGPPHGFLGPRIYGQMRAPAGAPPGTTLARVGPPPPKTLDALFGIHSQVVWTHEGDIIIGPAVPIEERFSRYLAVLAVAITAAGILSWRIGRWITGKAVEPLTEVTKELQRFAEGDFTPIVLHTPDDAELGALVRSYNGAAGQVAAAFSERERNEEHLRLFLGEAGHEMRTPLTVISSYFDMLDRLDRRDDLPSRMLQIARKEAQRLRLLIDRVTALARMEGEGRSGFELIDVVEAVQDAIARVKHARTGIVEIIDRSDDVVVLAERWELDEALGNLIENAVKYGACAPVRVEVEALSDQIAVRVTNEGNGISECDRPRLFQHFFRGEGATRVAGSGLGLAIVARAAARMGGGVALEQPGPPQTTFCLTIPMYRAKPQVNVLRIG